jgi:glutamine synthetase adenylyltransferase
MFSLFLHNDQESKPAESADAMRRLGFLDPAKAVEDLQAIRDIWSANRTTNVVDEPPWFASLTRVLRDAPQKDHVLQMVRTFVVNARTGFDPFALFEQSPRSLEVLARVACGSPFLMQTVLAEPDSLRNLLDESRTAEMKSRDDFIRNARHEIGNRQSRHDKLTALRVVHHRELLRIGLCDAFGLFDLRCVTLQLSLLADAMVQVCLEQAAKTMTVSPEDIAVIALGKLGGEELNYSSDVDLVIVADQVTPATQRLARLTVDGLADSSPSGFLYRVDLRLRPWGDAGPLVSTIASYSDYLKREAATWEKQALLKARHVAGNRQTGTDFVQQSRPLLFSQSASEARDSIRQMKARIEDRLRDRGRVRSEVKLGVGSIRDIEFVVQYLQLVHGRAEKRVLRSNTLDALVRLTEFGVMQPSWYQQLRAGYVFFRSVEHALQLLHNQQTHELPDDVQQREWLANRLDYPDADTLMSRFHEHRVTVRRIFEQCIGEASDIPHDQTERHVSLSNPVTSPPESGSDNPDDLDERQASTTLIRRFRQWLPSSSEPNVALQRFRGLLDQLLPRDDWDDHAESLRRPEILSVMARVLGISPYFWEEFLQRRFSQMWPILEASADQSQRVSPQQLQQELQIDLAECASPSETRTAVNMFKDRQLFRIDLRFILGRTRPFGTFSQEVTELAEVVVWQMAKVVYAELVTEHGPPSCGPGHPCPWTIAALGKFGGVEMGFASDIELMLVFHQHGTTTGQNPVANAKFFDSLVTQTAVGLAARHDGIFHVDLRMRPHGQAGSPAVALTDFETYYAPDGTAWPYERQSLVKLRCVGGDHDLQQRVQHAVVAAIYVGQQFDFASMRAMRERQIRQLVRGGRINAKLSDGGLVDCEYAVQALQLTFGHLHASLRTTTTLQALDNAARLGLVPPAQHVDVRETYVFLRDLIDCLRLERGLARDLTVPTDDSDGYQQLSNRLKQVQSNAVPLTDLDCRLQIISQFSCDVQRHCRNLRSDSDHGSLAEPPA